MASEKVSLSLDASLVKQAREVAGPRSLSAFVNDALRIKLQHVRMRRLLDEMDAEFGPVAEETAEEVRRQWPVADKRPRRAHPSA
jgi:hypothetical protein